LKSTTSDDRSYFCNEPWTGLFSVSVDQDVVFCPCYLQMRIGNLRESTMNEVWNAPVLVEMRDKFAAGTLPTVCEGQLCPVVLGEPVTD
jgi:hypothetical protein